MGLSPIAVTQVRWNSLFFGMASLARQLSVRLRTKWLRIPVLLESLKFNTSHRTCFEHGVPWHSHNYRVWIHSETHTWHDKNIQWRTHKHRKNKERIYTKNTQILVNLRFRRLYDFKLSEIICPRKFQKVQWKTPNMTILQFWNIKPKQDLCKTVYFIDFISTLFN